MILSSNKNKTIKNILSNELKHKMKYHIISFNSLTSFIRKSPEIFVGGSLKCGTTSLYNYLIEHNSISPSLQKEVHFFNYNYDRGLKWYKGNFPITLSKNKKTIDATPSYLFCTKTPKRISKYTKDPKIIFLFRNPVERSISHYHYISKVSYNNNQKISFIERIESELNWLESKDINELYKSNNLLELITRNFPLLGYGIYSKALNNWLKIFNNENILLVNSSDFFGNEKKSMKKILKFLNLNEDLDIEYKVFNENKYEKINSKTIDLIKDFYRPFNEELEKMSSINFRS